MLEEYNGLGQASGPSGWVGKPYTPERKQKFAPQPSAYIWAGTDQYETGKYVADHIYDSTVVDQQLGCAGLLVAMAVLDQSIHLIPGISPEPTPVPPKVPSITNPAPGSIGAFIASLFKRLFGRK